MKRTLLIVAVSVGFAGYSQQVEKCCESTPLIVEITPASAQLPDIDNFDGTYQFRVPENDGFSFTTNLLDRISTERSQDEDVLLDLGNGRSVLILSEDKINDPAFVPFSTPYVFN